MLRPEKGKGFQTIELVWVPAMEEFFGLEAPVSLQLRTPSPTQDNVGADPPPPAGEGQCVGAAAGAGIAGAADSRLWCCGRGQ